MRNLGERQRQFIINVTKNFFGAGLGHGRAESANDGVDSPCSRVGKEGVECGRGRIPQFDGARWGALWGGNNLADAGIGEEHLQRFAPDQSGCTEKQYFHGAILAISAVNKEVRSGQSLYVS